MIGYSGGKETVNAQPPTRRATPDSPGLLSTLCFLAGWTERPAKKSVRDPDVTVVHPADQEITRYLDFTGTTAPVETVDVRAQGSGIPPKDSLQA